MPVIQAIIPNEVLNNNSKIPILGLGSTGWGNEEGATRQGVKDAIDLGYRHIDTTPIGKNEVEVGEAIAAKIKEGVVKREELYVVGKMLDTKIFHNPALIKAGILTTLRNLNLAYIDLYIITCPEGDLFAADAFTDTWDEMEKLVDYFLVKSIGLANFNAQQIQHLLISARVSPAVNQLECHPHFAQKALQEFCSQKRILVTAFNVFGSPALIEAPMIMDMAKKYKRTPEQILIRYQIDKGHLAVPQVRGKSELMSNLDVFKFEINESDLAALSKLDGKKQYI